MKSTWRATPPILARADCTTCNGTGWELLPVAGSSHARRCWCGGLDRLLRLKEQVRIPRRYQHCTLDNFQPFTLSQSRALAEARKFAEQYPNVARGLFFSGGPGIGKTHLAVGIVRAVLQRFQDDVLFADFECFLGSNLTFYERTPWGDPDLERFEKVALLVLDNFELAPLSWEANQCLQTLLSSRSQLNKPTVFTGESIQRGALLREAGPLQGKTTPNKNSLSLLCQRKLLDLMTDVKFVPMRGDDFRQMTSSELQLF